MINGFISLTKFDLAAIKIDEFIAQSVNLNQEACKKIIQDFSESFYNEKQIVIENIEQYMKSSKKSLEPTIKENTGFFNRTSNDFSSIRIDNKDSTPNDYKKGFVNNNRGAKNFYVKENKENQKSVKMLEEIKNIEGHNEITKISKIDNYPKEIINKFTPNNISFGKKISSSIHRKFDTENQNPIKSQINLKYL